MVWLLTMSYPPPPPCSVGKLVPTNSAAPWRAACLGPEGPLCRWGWTRGPGCLVTLHPGVETECHVVVISQVAMDKACPSPLQGDQAEPPHFSGHFAQKMGLGVQGKGIHLVCVVLVIRSVSLVLRCK